ncbi:MAG TPA: 4Fe-4S dicluster domain-containing protein [Candidatus Limnocylindria bacterium]|nr:4Fe-4S dicluster domain-containing protein [Candidatus Limnocylindria bacterium]
MASGRPAVIDVTGLSLLIDVLRADGWAVIGPTVQDGVIGQAEIQSLDDLPCGVGDEQDGAFYRLRVRDDAAYFGYVLGPQSWKSVLFPSRELVRRARPGNDPSTAREHDPELRPLALFGVRSCDLHAIAVHDQVLTSRAVVDDHYAERREGTFIVAVTCADPAGTCFCTSMGTGPDPTEGFDLALTELLDDRGHRFLVRPGTDKGVAILERLPKQPVLDADRTTAAAVVESASGRMGRELDTSDIRDLLYANPDHPQWDDVANRCLACSNCTLVCPTCFCTSVEDSTSLVDGTSDRWRVWDSCFTSEFSYLHGGSVRATTKSRYRQWATHKLAAWWDQFGTSGCVGCGRCITWCPAAIDLTAEVAALRATPSADTLTPPATQED